MQRVREQLIPIKSKRRSGQRIKKVKFFVDHDTGNPGSTAQNNVDYYIRSCNDMSASAHAFIDDKEVIICIPCYSDTMEKAWHVMYDKPKDNQVYGIDSNDGAIGIELCYFPGDKARSQKSYQNYIEFAAMLCQEHKVSPVMRSSHKELDPQRRNDPDNALKLIGKTYQDMKNDIAATYNTLCESTDTLYKAAVMKLVDKGIIGSPAAWWPKINLKNVEPLIIKIGVHMFKVNTYNEVINKMIEIGIISNAKIWQEKSYIEKNVRDLIVKVAATLP